MENKSKTSNPVSKFVETTPDFNVFVVILSAVNLFAWIFNALISDEKLSAIGILALGILLFCSGSIIGTYRERCKAAEKKQNEAENQQDAIEAQQG